MQRDQRNCGSYALLAMITAAALTGCGGGSDSGTATKSPDGVIYRGSSTPTAVVAAQTAHMAVDPEIVAADNAFGLNLLNTLTDGTNNVAISPISLSLALQILYNGAAGTTQTDMGTTLQLGGLSVQGLNNANAALQASLIDSDPEVQLTIANSLWVDVVSSPVLPSFTQMDETYYGATLGDLAGAPATVNAWVAEETHGLITDLLSPIPPPDGYKVAILANALYFKGQWTTAFDPSQTSPETFTLASGSQISATLMHQTGPFEYFQAPNAQVIRVPYGEGRFSMLIALPDPSVGIAEFVSGITNLQLVSWESKLQDGTVTISLPRFSATYGKSLPTELSSLGMGVVFSPVANFSALAPGAYVSDVVHKTVVEVDETGTVAAAGSGITIIGAVTVPIVMTVDRPFFYAIQDNQTGELLFVGVLMNPSSN